MSKKRTDYKTSNVPQHYVLETELDKLINGTEMRTTNNGVGIYIFVYTHQQKSSRSGRMDILKEDKQT